MKDTGHYRLSILRTEKEFDRLEPEWNELADRSEGAIFQTFDWNRVWWNYYGKGKSLHIVLIRMDGELVGIAPFFEDCINLFGRKASCSLRLIGSNVSQPSGFHIYGLQSYTDYLDLILKRDVAEECCQVIGNYLATSCRDFDRVVFDYLPESSLARRYLMPVLKTYPETYPDEKLADKSWQIELAHDWTSYLKRLKKSRRYKARLQLKRVTDSTDSDKADSDKKVFDINEPATLEEAIELFDRMVQMHQDKWNENGALGTFYQKRDYAFHKEIVSCLYDKGCLQIKVVTPAGQPDQIIGYDLNYLYRQRLYGMHTAIDEDSPLHQYGPGMSLLYATLKEAVENKINCYDFMRGDEVYKSRLSDRMTRMYKVSIHYPGRVKRYRIWLFDQIIFNYRYLCRKRIEMKLKRGMKPDYGMEAENSENLGRTFHVPVRQE